MQVVFEKYLPLSWVNESEEESSSKLGTSSCRPQLAAVELIRALCRAGQGIASQLVSLSVLSVGLFVAGIHDFLVSGFKVQPSLSDHLLHCHSSFRAEPPGV